MNKHDMFDHIDPYDMIIQIQNRLLTLENAHNALAHRFQKTESEFNVLLVSHQALQTSMLNLTKLMADINLQVAELIQDMNSLKR